ncbi:MAG: hypothetical protein P8O79_14495 [Halieaceae bacterium]|nr:hypothetical protein [Halieaceae bacterium]
MKELNRSELQKIWDESLLACWKADSSGWSIATAFLTSIESEFAEKLNGTKKPTDAEFAQIKNFLASLQLSRCLDWATNGALEFRPSKTARAFVAEHCERLNNCLWSGKHTNEAILDSINNFRWLKKGRKVNNALRGKYSKISHSPVDIRIRARELSKKSDWATIK